MQGGVPVLMETAFSMHIRCTSILHGLHSTVGCGTGQECAVQDRGGVCSVLAMTGSTLFMDIGPAMDCIALYAAVQCSTGKGGEGLDGGVSDW